MSATLEETDPAADPADGRWWLPNFLPRKFQVPLVPSVDSMALGALDETFNNASVPETRSWLRSQQVRYINGLHCILPQAHHANAPARIITLVQDPNPNEPYIRPDHAFVLENNNFFPFHAVLMAAYCARVTFQPLPSPPSSSPNNPRHFDIRFTRLAFSNALAMACFREWVYRQDQSVLRPILLPHSISFPGSGGFEALRDDVGLRRRVSRELASNCTEQLLWDHVSSVLDCRRLMTLLGVDDERIWAAMTVAWDVLLHALNAACEVEAVKDELQGKDTSAIRALLNNGLEMDETSLG